MAVKQTQLTQEAAEQIKINTNSQRAQITLFGKKYYRDELPKEVIEILNDLDIVQDEIKRYKQLVAVLGISRNALLKEIKAHL